jgi:hypothetical protein
MVRIAYADPPYLGNCSRYGHAHYGGGCWDDLETHRSLVVHLATFDGWALSLNTHTLRAILPLVPPSVRILAWCKRTMGMGLYEPRSSWEPVLVMQARKRRSTNGLQDWLASVPPYNGVLGAKPADFVVWVMACIGAEPSDDVSDLFLGSGAVSSALATWRDQTTLAI